MQPLEPPFMRSRRLLYLNLPEELVGLAMIPLKSGMSPRIVGMKNHFSSE